MKLILTTGVLASLVFVTISCSRNDGPITPKKEFSNTDRLKNLKFSTPSSGTNSGETTNTGSGYSNPSSGGNFARPSSGTGTPVLSEGQNFSNPYEGNAFVVNPGGLSQGGGSFTLGNNSYDIAVSLCLGGDLFGFDFDGDTTLPVSILLGIAGEFNLSDPDESFLEAIIYLVIIDDEPDGYYEVLDYNDSEPSLNAGFVVVFVADENDPDTEPTLYVSASGGGISVSDGNVSINGLEMTKLDNDDNPVGNTESLSASLECGELIFEGGQ